MEMVGADAGSRGVDSPGSELDGATFSSYTRLLGFRIFLLILVYFVFIIKCILYGF